MIHAKTTISISEDTHIYFATKIATNSGIFWYVPCPSVLIALDNFLSRVTRHRWSESIHTVSSGNCITVFPFSLILNIHREGQVFRKPPSSLWNFKKSVSDSEYMLSFCCRVFFFLRFTSTIHRIFTIYLEKQIYDATLFFFHLWERFSSSRCHKSWWISNSNPALNSLFLTPFNISQHLA